MQIEAAVRRSIGRGISLRIFLYALPVALLFLRFSIKGHKRWENPLSSNQTWFLNDCSDYAISSFGLLLGLVEFLSGRYGQEHWDSNEKLRDLVCFPVLIVRPFFTYFSSYS